LRSQGFKVLQTKEPGTPHVPLTLELRGIMLDQKHNDHLSTTARELINQAIRSIHLEKCVIPALDTYDFIIQDRGMLSGIAYGEASGNDVSLLETLAQTVTKPRGLSRWNRVYDLVVLLQCDPVVGLARAQVCKQEFIAGDVMEARGPEFMKTVHTLMNARHDEFFAGHPKIDVTDQSMDSVFQQALSYIL